MNFLDLIRTRSNDRQVSTADAYWQTLQTVASKTLSDRAAVAAAETLEDAARQLGKSQVDIEQDLDALRTFAGIDPSTIDKDFAAAMQARDRAHQRAADAAAALDAAQLEFQAAQEALGGPVMGPLQQCNERREKLLHIRRQLRAAGCPPSICGAEPAPKPGLSAQQIIARRDAQIAKQFVDAEARSSAQAGGHAAAGS